MVNDRTPALYLSHGAPPLADDALWTRQLADWSAELPKPTAILVVSAHWEEAPLAIGATQTVPLYYDFWGFPQHYYEVQYRAPGAPELAAKVRKLIPGAVDVPDRGLDHGAYVPLVEMYPAADVPVLQISMPTLDPEKLLEIGRKLAPLRDEGVLIIGSGFFTHNLRGMDISAGFDSVPPKWSSEFDEWGVDRLNAGDLDSLADFLHKSPSGRMAHPRTEHFAPLFVTLGAAEVDLATQRTIIEGFWGGLSKRSIQLG
ncbi:dioxygenase [Rhizocola hellebori]|uniref:Dioxygenase n=1 Tax=Rhizocola hellebori TaxID=1392758 RepID=A0A8J3QEG9_9ACTN|nr:class III extradiol ring-cleavage dioxygenase [Rhizocola hellebori]GIH09345.1 dioxygenase [Rhizocola hellebori]